MKTLSDYPIEDYTPERIQEAYLIVHPKVLEKYEISRDDFYGVFERGSNFSHLKYPIRDEFWNVFEDSEWYYMSLRFDNLEIKKLIAAASKTKGGSKTTAYEHLDHINNNREDRIQFMCAAISQKNDNSSWRRKLLTQTWVREIIELTYWWDDFFWICHDTRRGRNILWKQLVEYRNKLLWI